MDSTRQLRPIWQYYKELDEGLKAICLLCGRVVSRGGKTRSTCNSSNQKNHLRLTHPKEFEAVSSEILKHKAATPAKPATLKRQYRKYPTVPRDTSDCGSPNLSAHLPGMPQRALDHAEYPGPSSELRPQSQPESLNGEAMQGTHNATEPWSNHELLTNALNAVLNSASDLSNGGGAWHADESTAHQDAMKQEPMDETEIAKRPSDVEQPHWARGTHSHCKGSRELRKST